MPKFNNVGLSQETIEATRQHFADIYHDCIQDALSGRVKVNDIERYVAWETQMIANMLGGHNDHTLTFLQRAYWIQTGEMIALLP